MLTTRKIDPHRLPDVGFGGERDKRQNTAKKKRRPIEIGKVNISHEILSRVRIDPDEGRTKLIRSISEATTLG